MGSVTYTLHRLPDLTLNKYSALEQAGVPGVLRRHEAFYRQMHRKGMLSREYMRLTYACDPTAPAGRRLSVTLRFDGEGPVRYTDELMRSSPIGPYFDFVRAGEGERSAALVQPFAHRASLCKQDRELPCGDPDSDETYYQVGAWTPSKNGRLLGMMKLMQSLNVRCTYSVGLWPMECAGVYARRLDGLMRSLRRAASLSVGRGGSRGGVERDQNAEQTLRSYEKLLESMAAGPNFFANIQAFSDDPGVAAMLLDAAAAEAVEKGSWRMRVEAGSYSAADLTCRDMEFSADSSACAVPDELRECADLYLLEEIVPFAVFPSLYAGESVELPKETAPDYERSGLLLGRDDNGYDVYVPLSVLPKHVFISGTPGSGKTYTMLHVISQLMADFGVPALIFEPAKQEYRALTKHEGLERLTVFAPTSGTRFPLHINPFEFPLGMSLDEHIRRLEQVFEGAFYLEDPMPRLLDQAMEQVYRDAGWLPFLKNTGALPYPTMRQLYNKLEEILERDTSYEPDIKGNLKSYIQVRIGSLLSRTMGDVFDVASSTLRPEEWLTRSAVLELEAMGSEPANFLTLMLATLIRETLRVSPAADPEKPRHILFFDEAHNLIGPTAEKSSRESADTKTASTAYLVDMLAEVRALGEAIVIADQLPTAMAPQILKNTSVKIGHRIASVEDRELLGGTMSADAVQLERMGSYAAGRALCIYGDMQKPFEVQIRRYDGDSRSPTDDELFGHLKNTEGFVRDMRRDGEIVAEKFGGELQELRRKADRLEERIGAYLNNRERLRNFAAEDDAGRRLYTEADTKLRTQRIVLSRECDGIYGGMAELAAKAQLLSAANPLAPEFYGALIERIAAELLQFRRRMAELDFPVSEQLRETWKKRNRDGTET